jgi:hypothetical protein
MGAAGSAAGGAAGGGAAASSGPSKGTVTLKFTTKTYGGFYAPRNYGAVWFETKDGKFVKTAKRWAGAAHATDLSAWNKASGGWPGPRAGANANAADMMDAVSSATLRDHETHMVMWNVQDVDKKVVADGDYVAVVELTEDRAQTPGPVLRVPFKKGAEPQMVDAPDEESFTGISLTYQP